jgi:oxygen-independent coproporphyrinogen-3 oxidase
VDGVRQATYAAPRPADYMARVAATGVGFATREPLTPREAAQERVLSGLRIAEGVGRDELAALAIPAERVAHLVSLGLLADDPRRLRATPAGRLVLDRLTAELAI